MTWDETWYIIKEMGENNNIQCLRTGIMNAHSSPPGCATVVGRTQKVLSIPRHSAL